MPNVVESNLQHLGRERSKLRYDRYKSLAILLLAHSPLLTFDFSNPRLHSGQFFSGGSSKAHQLFTLPRFQLAGSVSMHSQVPQELRNLQEETREQRLQFLDGNDVSEEGAHTQNTPEEATELLQFMDGADALAEDEDEKRAHREELALRDSSPFNLSASGIAADVLRKEGVVMVGDVLPAEEAALLREQVFDELTEQVNFEALDRFTDVLGSHNTEKVERRWDLRLRATPAVQTCLMKTLAGVVGDVIETVAGRDAQLFELAAFISAPGSPPQPLHGDTESWEDALFTAIVPLQHVSADMGPTRFIRGSHTEEAHEEFDDGMDDGSFIEEWGHRVVKGPFHVGEVAIYDSRVIHAGSQNFHQAAESTVDVNNDGTRVLFYFTFRGAEADVESNVQSLLPKYRKRYTLNQFRSLEGCVFEDE